MWISGVPPFWGNCTAIASTGPQLCTARSSLGAALVGCGPLILSSHNPTTPLAREVRYDQTNPRLPCRIGAARRCPCATRSSRVIGYIRAGSVISDLSDVMQRRHPDFAAAMFAKVDERAEGRKQTGIAKRRAMTLVNEAISLFTDPSPYYYPGWCCGDSGAQAPVRQATARRHTSQYPRSPDRLPPVRPCWSGTGQGTVHPWSLPWKYFAPRRSLLSKTNPIRPAAAARNSNLSELSSIA